MGKKVRMISDMELLYLLESNIEINYDGFTREELTRMIKILRNKILLNENEGEKK